MTTKTTQQNVLDSTVRMEIFAGPGKEDFVKSASSGDSSSRFYVTFLFTHRDLFTDKSMDKSTLKLQGVINGYDWEDGSGQSWLIRTHGQLEKYGTTEGSINTPTLHGYFNTRSRQGWINIPVRQLLALGIYLPQRLLL